MGSIKYFAASTGKKCIPAEKVFHVVIGDMPLGMPRNFNYFIVYLELWNINFVSIFKAYIDKIVFIFLRCKDLNMRVFFLKRNNPSNMIIMMVGD
jgi:hypothetical protein